MHSYGKWRLKHFQKYNIEFFYYIFPIENTVSILRNGILPKNYVKNKFSDSKSFSWDSVQLIRSRKKIILTGRKEVDLHDAVPLFFNPQNPTLYVKKDDWDKLAILVIDKNVVIDDEIEIAFSKGNASRSDAQILRNLKELENIDWEILFGNYWPKNVTRTGIDWENWKSHRSSEFLIYPKVNKKWFRKIIVSNEKTLKQIDRYLKSENKFLDSFADKGIFM